MVTGGGSIVCKRDYVVSYTGTKDFGIEYVKSGRGSIAVDGVHHMLEAGDLFAYAPDTPYTIVSDSCKPLERYFITFSGHLAQETLGRWMIAPGEVVKTLPPDALAVLFEEVMTCGQSHAADSAILCTKLLECIFMKAADNRSVTNARRSASFQKYQKCKLHIQHNFLRLANLDQIAVECKISPSYICHLFHMYGKETPYQYLTRLKMFHASTLLQSTDILIKQVAVTVGFDDPFHFSRVFRNTFGVSPEKMRSIYHA